MTRDDVARWLSAYVDAWKSYDPEAIGALFADDAEYRYHPYDDEPVRGRDRIVAAWLDDPDEPGTYEAAYEPIALDGEVAVATGTSTYRKVPGGEIDRVYHNCFVIRYDEGGRCREFTEWFMEPPAA